jgi:hypothetical protein
VRERELIRNSVRETQKLEEEEEEEKSMGFQQRSIKKRLELAKALSSPMADLCNPIPFFYFFFYNSNIFLLIFIIAYLIFLFLI